MSEIIQIINLARKGIKPSQELLRSFGINWGKPGVYRFINQDELRTLTSGQKYMGRFNNGLVDVTGSDVPTTALSADYKVVFKPVHDLYFPLENGNRARMKNSDLQDGWITEGYSLDDVSLILKRSNDGQYIQFDFRKEGGSLNYLNYIPRHQLGKAIQYIAGVTKKAPRARIKVAELVTHQAPKVGDIQVLSNVEPGLRGAPMTARRQAMRDGTFGLKYLDPYRQLQLNRMDIDKLALEDLYVHPNMYGGSALNMIEQYYRSKGVNISQSDADIVLYQLRELEKLKRAVNHPLVSIMDQYYKK